MRGSQQSSRVRLPPLGRCAIGRCLYPTVVEGPGRWVHAPVGPKIGERQGAPGDYVTNPDELFPNGLNETSEPDVGACTRTSRQKPPYYEPGQTISEHATIQEPVVLQGSRGSLSKVLQMDRSGSGDVPMSTRPRRNCNETWCRRSYIADRLQPSTSRARSEAEVKG